MRAPIPHHINLILATLPVGTMAIGGSGRTGMVWTDEELTTGLLPTPLSSSAMFGRDLIVISAYSGKMVLNLLDLRLKAWDVLAKFLLSAAVPRIAPVVSSSEFIKESRPVRIVSIDHAGFQEPG